LFAQGPGLLGELASVTSVLRGLLTRLSDVLDEISRLLRGLPRAGCEPERDGQRAVRFVNNHDHAERLEQGGDGQATRRLGVEPPTSRVTSGRTGPRIRDAHTST
jgi:hypothetical protein